ncbi:MAG: type II secretion system protein GspC [Thiotrichales bacterium]|nr:MAG: type II secretion system protein GspC [Thiotrichales bacterium]
MTNQLTALFANTAFLQQLNQRLPAIISLLLVIACAHALARITWMFLPEAEIAVQQRTSTRAPVVNRVDPNQAIRQVANAHLFGEMEAAALPRQAKAPKTRLNLVLRGVIAADPMSMSHAIIAQGKNGKEEVYAVGDKMPGGIIIEEVHPDHVVLNRGGRLESLQLVKDEDVGKISSRQPRGAHLPAGSPGEQLASIRQEIMQNPTSFGNYALPVVVKRNGKQLGYRLQPQQKGTELMQQVGLQANDVITEINGIKLDNPQNGIGALRQLSTANSVSITVMRNGTEVPLNIQLQ